MTIGGNKNKKTMRMPEAPHDAREVIMYRHDCQYGYKENVEINLPALTSFFNGCDREEPAIDTVSDLPVFPEFRALVLSDKEVLDKMLKAFPPEISELTFTNLYSWRKSFGYCIAACGEHILIAACKDNSMLVLDPIGPEAGKKAVIEHCFKLKPEGLKFAFIRLPESTVSLFRGEVDYVRQEDRDNFDYVYRTADLAELKGRKLDGKRNLVKHFREATEFEYQPLTQSDIPEALRFEDEWCDIKGCANSPGLSREREAMEEMLRNFQALGLSGGIIRVSGKVVAVALGERLNRTTCVIHVEKANSAFPGIYQAINMLYSQSGCAETEFINREQDLGIPGLRQAKQSYHPDHMVKKYTLRKD